MGTANKRRPEKLPVAAKPLAAGVEAPITREKPLRPGQCKKHLRMTVAAAFRDIVAGFVNEAKLGSVQHMKAATEVVESAKRVRKPRGKGPTRRLLDSLVLE